MEAAGFYHPDIAPVNFDDSLFEAFSSNGLILCANVSATLWLTMPIFFNMKVVSS